MCEWFTLTPALSRRGRGGLIGVLCFSLGSRLRGNDGGVRGNDGGVCGNDGGGFFLNWDGQD